MKTKMLEEALAKVEQWPPAVQDELAQIAIEMGYGIADGTYHANVDEIAAIDEGLRAARAHDFATADEVEAAFAKFCKE
jgi:hypothetical protein